MVNPAAAVSNAVGNDACVSHDNAAQPPSPPREELLDLLRRIADHDDVPDTIQADARNYLRSLQAAAFGPHAHEVTQGLPRPRRGS